MLLRGMYGNNKQKQNTLEKRSNKKKKDNKMQI
jgi:hypothetical protein